jgi:ribosomal protein S18 acetylase RimI-like enzyme
VNEVARAASFHRLDEAATVGAALEPMLPLVHEAGNPYFDWFFGDRNRARDALREWMNRRSSEVYVGRMVVATDGVDLIGGFIALPGAELEQCRSADAIAAMKTVGREGLSALRERMRIGQSLFPPVERDDFYLSKIGVLRNRRAHGFGQRLLERYLDEGRQRGLHRFRLDVSTDNESAIRFYERRGFGTLAESSAPEAEITYLAMVFDD